MNLRNPKFGNIFISDSHTSFETTVDGQKVSIRPEEWPTIRRFEVAFEALSKNEADQMMNFYEAVAAQEIQITDHEKNIWSGFITTTSPSIAQSRPGCGYETSFEFEGDIIGVEEP